jgi:hypothetical protein
MKGMSSVPVRGAAGIPHEFLWRRSLSFQPTRCQNVTEQTFVVTVVPDEKKTKRIPGRQFGCFRPVARQFTVASAPHDKNVA